MKIRVVYFSQTGKTAKVAQAMAKALGVTAEEVRSASPLDPADLLLLGGAVYATFDHDLHPELKGFISKLGPSTIKRAAVFSTGFSQDNSRRILGLLKKRNLTVSEEFFHSKGQFLFFNFGHPNGKDLLSAVEFARRMVK